MVWNSRKHQLFYKYFWQWIQINGNGNFSIDENFELEDMVTDAIWMDIDNDKDNDLLVVGEWMAISVFENEGGTQLELYS